MAEKITTRFRRLIKDHKLLLIPGGFSPLGARMAEEVGFEAFFLAGSQSSAFLYGLPDIGLMGRKEMVEATQNITAVSDIAVFVDCDTGYGNSVNAYHAVQGYVRAGAAGLHIEDQEFPKLSGTGAGRKCISVEEAVGKYKAAVAARDAIDPDFVICARCDLIGADGGSFDAAVERCIAYVEEAKVDLIWLNNVQEKGQIEEAAKRIPGAVMPTFGGAPPAPSLEELEAWGIAAAIFPAMTTSVGLQATWEFLNDFKERGQAAADERREQTRASKWGAVRFSAFSTPNADMVKEIEDKYLPEESQRDYENTFGHFAQPS